MPSFGNRNGHDSDHSTPINSLALKRAIQLGASALGTSAIDSLIEELNQKGIDLNDHSSRYTLQQIEEALIDMFGSEVAILLIERIAKALKDG